MGKNIIVRFEESGLVRCFPVPVEPGTTSRDILSRWRMNEYLLQDAVTNVVYPRRSFLLPLIRDGQILEAIHESLVKE